MILAIDIGGTYTKYGYVCEDKVFNQGKWKTVFSFDEVCGKIEKRIRADTEKICISSGGFWYENGVCIGYASIPEMCRNNLLLYLKNKYGIPVFIQNDARCALLCEQKYGVLHGCENAVMFVLGSSVGSAALVNGKLYEGAHKKSGMFFKMPETLEPYGYEFYSNTVKQTSIYKNGFSLEDCNMQDIEAFAKQGEKTAENILKEYAKAVAKKIVFAKLVYDPQIIAVGGGISNSDKIFKDISEEYNRLLAEIGEPADTPVQKAKFGENSNLIGASLIGS